MNTGKAIAVLYVDDEEDMLDICKRYLELSPDIIVRTESSVLNAENILATERFDVIISDYQMPELSGIDFLKRIRMKGNDIGFILFTGKGREEVVIEAVNAGADAYIQKGGDARAQFTELSLKIRRIVAKKQAERSLRESEENYRMLFEGIQEGMAYCQMMYDSNRDPIDWRYLKVNAQFAVLTGLKDVEGKKVSEVIPGTLEKDPVLLRTYNRVATTGRPEKFEAYINSLGQWLDISVISPSEGCFSAIFEDVTVRKRSEQERDITIEFLRLVNCSKNVDELIRSALTFFQRQSGCEAVGIRLKDGFDFPYWEARGFPEEFVWLETHLCSYDEHGKACLDSGGNPILECMCGNVICGRFDPSKDFFTSSGSFWTNCTTALLESTTDSDRQARTRNRCNGEGYESVALIPLYLGKERYGLIQMNDRRKGIYSPFLIAQWERLAGYLAMGLSKFITDEALRVSEEKYRSLFETINESAAFFEYVLDSEGKLVDFICQDINPAGLAAMGLRSSKDLIGRSARSLDQDSILPQMESVERMRRTGMMVLEEKHIERGNRDTVNAMIPIDRDHFILTSRDETDIKGMQRAADQEATRLRTVIDVLPIGLVITDEQGGFVEYNGFAKDAWGGELPIARSVDQYDLFRAWWHDSGIELRPDEWGIVVALRSGETVLGQVLTIQGFDGVRRSIVNNAAPIKGKDGRITGSVAAIQDITRSMIQEEALRVANGKLKLLDTINRHDIRNQLMVLRGNLEIARRFVTDPDGMKRLDVVRKAAETIEKHIDFAKQYQELGRTSPIWHSLQKEIVTTLENSEQVDIDLKGERTCKAEILADSMLPKVFQNLLENSIRYGDKPGKIIVHCETDGTDLLVIYEDRGAGIPYEEKEKIFEKGFGKGSGLGLFLIREILGITGIGIQENGVPGQGARFEIRVPQGRYRMGC